jgi:hypothetical protein
VRDIVFTLIIVPESSHITHRQATRQILGGIAAVSLG